jgi:hypothetical protein
VSIILGVGWGMLSALLHKHTYLYKHPPLELGMLVSIWLIARLTAVQRCWLLTCFGGLAVHCRF